MAKTTRTNASTPDVGWLSNPDELPRADVELKDKAAGRQKLYRFAVVAVLFVGFPLSAFGNLAMLPKILDSKPAAVSQPGALTSETKPAAMLAVQNWLAQSPSPLPGGQLLSWDGVDIQAAPEIIVDPNTNQTTEKQGLQLHHITVASATGQIFNTTIQVAYSKVRGSQVIGLPSLVPKAPDDKGTWPGVTSWPNLTTLSATDPMIQSATAWVKAFTSGNTDTLRLAVGDQDISHSYIPLAQVTATDVQVAAVGYRKDVKAGDSAPKPTQVVARVTFAIQWQGQDLGTTKTPSRVSYDILLNRADGGAPVVVAWGGVGTGESLTEFMNAENRKITSDGVEKSVASATATAKAPAPAGPTPSPTSVPNVGTVTPPTPSAGK